MHFPRAVVLGLAVGIAACKEASPSPASAAGDAGAEDEGVPAAPARISTIAGENSEVGGFADGEGKAQARFSSPEGLALDLARRHLYIADTGNHAVRRLDLGTGQVTTVAGVGTRPGLRDTTGADGPALLDAPRNLALSADGSTLFVTDTGNAVIRRFDVATSALLTVYGTPRQPGATDGVGTAARFGQGGIAPWSGGIVIDSRADATKPVMYVADSANQTIRAVDLTTSEVTTLTRRVGVLGAVDGPLETATFNKPAGLALGGAHDLYVTEANNLDIRKIDLVARTVTTVAGKAPADPFQFCENISFIIPPECGWVDAPRGVDARFRFPFGVSPDSRGGFFVVDSHNNLIRHFDPQTTAVTTVAGVQREILDDLPHASVDSSPTRYGSFWHPTHVAFEPPNILYVADRSANCIRRVEMGVAER